MATAPRTIVHADMDAFYASIEQLDDPSLRGQPILVGPDSGRGVVLTASYEARPYRVGSAMPMAVARRRCPPAVIVPPRFSRYREVSARVMAVFRDFSPRVEPISLDEAFLDMTGTTHIFGEPAELGNRLKRAIETATEGLTVSVGIASTKFVAKVASGFRKPDGLTIVPEAEARDWLSPLPVAVLWGAGPKAQAKLEAAGLRTVGDVAAADPGWLECRLGKLGRRFHALANATDARSVSAEHEARSLSAERTLNRDTGNEAEIRGHLRKAADTVARRLREAGLVAGGVRVKMKRADFAVVSRQKALATPTAVTADLYAAAIPLAQSLLEQRPFRLVGLGVYDLAAGADAAQLDMLGGEGARAARLDSVLDQAAARFGAGALKRARQIETTVLDDSTDLDFLTRDRRKT